MKAPTVAIPAFIVFSTTAGFFTLLFLLFFSNVPQDSKDILFTLTGLVGAKWGSLIDYYFGFSAAKHGDYYLRVSSGGEREPDEANPKGPSGGRNLAVAILAMALGSGLLLAGIVVMYWI